MKCVAHLEKDAVGVCNHCAKSICSDCLVAIKGENYCKDCVAVKMGSAKKEERSPVLAAILSFIIAGMGQIYNGQIGKGILILFTAWLIIPWIIGIFDAYNIAKKINEGKIIVKSKPGCVVAAVISIVLFFAAIFIIGLLAAIAIPNLLRARSNANAAGAQARLQSIYRAAEAYKLDKGSYPVDMLELTQGQTPYLSQSYNDKPTYGYIFSETFHSDGFEASAVPEKCGITGSKIFTISQDGSVSSQDCVREKE